MRAGETIGGRFTIEAVASAGGVGTVYRARDVFSGAAVAVKAMRGGGERWAARLVREAQVLAELRHPRIVRYVADGVTEDGEIYLATEWLTGEDLLNRMQRERLTIAETISVGIGVAEALGAAHRRGI